MITMIDQGFISGIDYTPTKDGILFSNLENALITFKGVEYLFDNSLMQKLKRTLKDVKDILPGI